MKTNLDFDRFKISFDETKTKVFKNDDNSVTAYLYATVKVPSKTVRFKSRKEPITLPIDVEQFKIKGKGVARLMPGDEFDFNKGKKIALAKAENSIYKEVNNYLINRMIDLLSFNECVLDFNRKAEEVIDHNNRYIGSF